MDKDYSLSAIEDILNQREEEEKKDGEAVARYIEQRVKDAMGYEYDSTLFHGYE